MKNCPNSVGRYFHTFFLSILALLCFDVNAIQFYVQKYEDFGKINTEAQIMLKSSVNLLATFPAIS